MTTNEAPAAAEIAHAMSECMNLLFLFAAPRVLAAVRRSGGGGLEDPVVLAALRRFLGHVGGIRSRALSQSGPSADVARLVESAAIVEEIAGTLAGAGSSDPLPAPIVDGARRALAILGLPEPPGGWDGFEGFNVPIPPPARG
jgi:hypothetical protein